MTNIYHIEVVDIMSLIYIFHAQGASVVKLRSLPLLVPAGYALPGVNGADLLFIPVA